MSKTVLIGEPDLTAETDWGSTYKNGWTMLGKHKADYIDGKSDNYQGHDDIAAAICHAKPGVSAIGAGAQATQTLHFTGNQSGTLTLEFNIDYNVEAVVYGGSAAVTTRVFAYYLDNNEYLEIDEIRPASHGTMTAAGVWSNEGSAQEDIFVADVQPGDSIRIGVQVKTSAAAAALSGSYADAFGDEGSEHVALDYVSIRWE